jgi:hypothetical protein
MFRRRPAASVELNTGDAGNGIPQRLRSLRENEDGTATDPQEQERPVRPWERATTSSHPGTMWLRHGLLLSFLLAILGATSYQVARVYRHFMMIEVSALALTPAMLLVTIIASLFGLWGVSSRSDESVALAIIGMCGVFGFLGVLCNVVMILCGPA